MNERQKAKDRLIAELDNLKNGLLINLPCKGKDINYKTQFSDKTYTAIYTIDYLDKSKKRAYKNFEITGEYFPEISKFEYDDKKFVFLASSLEFIERVQEILNDLGASW